MDIVRARSTTPSSNNSNALRRSVENEFAVIRKHQPDHTPYCTIYSSKKSFVRGTIVVITRVITVLTYAHYKNVNVQ